MAKYHITPEGVKKCDASKKQCPYASNGHYDHESPYEMRQAEEKFKNKYNYQETATINTRNHTERFQKQPQRFDSLFNQEYKKHNKILGEDYTEKRLQSMIKKMNTPSFYGPKERVLAACEIGEALHNRIKVATAKEDNEYNMIMKKELTADDYYITPTRMILKNTPKNIELSRKIYHLNMRRQKKIVNELSRYVDMADRFSLNFDFTKLKNPLQKRQFLQTINTIEKIMPQNWIDSFSKEEFISFKANNQIPEEIEAFYDFEHAEIQMRGVPSSQGIINGDKLYDRSSAMATFHHELIHHIMFKSHKLSQLEEEYHRLRTTHTHGKQEKNEEESNSGQEFFKSDFTDLYASVKYNTNRFLGEIMTTGVQRFFWKAPLNDADHLTDIKDEKITNFILGTMFLKNKK